MCVLPTQIVITFNGNCDPNVYLGSEAKVEQIFSAYDVDEERHVKLASRKNMPCNGGIRL